MDRNQVAPHRWAAVRRRRRNNRRFELGGNRDQRLAVLRSGDEERRCRYCHAPVLSWSAHGYSQQQNDALCEVCSPGAPFGFGEWMSREQVVYRKNWGCTRWNRHTRIHLHSPQSFPLAQFQPESSLLLKRIKACIGWAIHGLVFEFVDGTRTGYVDDVTSLWNDPAIERRRGTEWVPVERGDYIVNIQGYNLSRPCFLCHTLTLKLASGRSIEFEAHHLPWKAQPFCYEVPRNCLIHHLSFMNGKCCGFSGYETAVHLPITICNISYLDSEAKAKVMFLMLLVRRIDAERVAGGDVPIGMDVWWSVFGMMTCSDIKRDTTNA